VVFEELIDGFSRLHVSDPKFSVCTYGYSISSGASKEVNLDKTNKQDHKKIIVV
jgi:hypothetical protein